MQQLKVQLADLVGSGAVQKLSSLLIGLADSLTEGGVMSDMILGRGKTSKEDLATQADEALEGKALQKVLKDMDIDEEEYKNLVATAGAEQGLFGMSSDAKGQGTLGLLKNSTIRDARNRVAEIDQAVTQTKASSGTYDDFILRPGQQPMRFNKNDLVIGGTNLGGGGDGKVAALLERLVTAVEAGGDVIMDGNKVGTTIAMTKSKFN